MLVNDTEAAWVEGFVTGLAEVRTIVDELLVRADSLVRGGKANSYLRELIRRWPIPDEPARSGEEVQGRDPLRALNNDSRGR